MTRLVTKRLPIFSKLGQRGVAFLEYLILATVIAVGCITFIRFIGFNVNHKLEDANKQLWTN